MGQEGDQPRHPRILLRGLAGQAPDEVPDDLQICLARPLEELDAAQRRRALAHQRENRRAQGLDTHLETADTRPDEDRQLLSGEVGPGLQVDEPSAGDAPLEMRKEVREVARREDLVGDEDRVRGVPSRELLELLERASAGLHAVRHRFAGLTAEAAAALLAPPAPARGLEGDARSERVVQRAPCQTGEVVVVSRAVATGPCPPAEGRRRALRPPRAAPAPAGVTQAGHAGERLSRQPPAHQLRQHRLALADRDGVDEGEGPQELSSHHAPAVGSAEDDGGVRPCFLEARGQSERGGVLTAHAGEADHQRAGREDLGEAGVEELGDPCAGGPQVVKQRRRRAASCRSAGWRARALLRPGSGPRTPPSCAAAVPGEPCEKTRSPSRSTAGQDVISSYTRGEISRREVDGGVEHRHPHIERLERRLEQPQRERWLPVTGERHVDEHDATHDPPDGYCAVQPPSMVNSAPVTHRDSSEAR